MPQDSTDRRIAAMFRVLQRRSASGTLPIAGALSNKLVEIVRSARGISVPIDATTLGLFATASIEMWQRALHSFLISASLTEASPIWASVSGYYSSHYSIRAFAHLLGCFQLTRLSKKILQVEETGNGYSCSIRPKSSGDAEHRYYWRIVKENSPFKDDPLFNKNDEGESSDKGHRCKANYLDHIDNFPAFTVLNKDYLVHRIKRIAETHFSAPPIPRVDSYPDVTRVQLIAYHRMVGFRSFVDNRIIENRFWSIHRNPIWCHDYLDFQVVQPSFVSTYREHLS